MSRLTPDGVAAAAPVRYDAVLETLQRGHGHRVQLLRDGSSLNYRETIELWCTDPGFTTEFTRLLGGCPFDSFRWETPSVNLASLDRSFEFVLLDAPDLAGRAVDVASFAAELSACTPESPVACFDNLGGDARLVAPCQLAARETYVDLASFSRGAPPHQQQALWRAVGESMANRLSGAPVWLSTAGGGVAWLHLRLDSRPKYYRHAPYRQGPAN